MIELIKKETINICKNEVYRYLGTATSEDDELNNIIDSCISEAKKIIVPKVCYDIFPVKFLKTGEIDLVFNTFFSKSLKKNLAGCKKVIVFVATIGIDIDRLIAKHSVLSPSKALIYNAVGAAAIENVCNTFVLNLKKVFEKDKSFLRPRFSPGYGDFDLNAQKSIFSVLDCSKKIGVSLTDRLLMIPEKSVSAIIGISSTDDGCDISGCEICKKTDCSFRRI